MRVGIISDTHGLLRPEVFDHFAGVEHILHAGDVGPADLLVELEVVAPVTAVWGNTDGWEIRQRCPEVSRLELAGVQVVVLHGQQLGSPTPEKVAAKYPEAGLVVFGHSHQAVIRQVGSVLAVNPGSAGPRRFRTTPSLALATLAEGRIDVGLVELSQGR
ncbi:MAG TPA: metallophosphoesterase family protein [Longimicrobiaceae bacterium]|nr:metallophosphoesterase family protein [Longimicrobiaceae bacterium]